MESEGSVPCSQEHITALYSDPTEFNINLSILFLILCKFQSISQCIYVLIILFIFIISQVSFI
jgi:hypothetical protein